MNARRPFARIATDTFHGATIFLFSARSSARSDALDPGIASIMRSARFIYLAGGSSMHLRSVLKNSPVWEALVEAAAAGAVVAASSDAAMAITDPMVDARGGALTLGLGLVQGVAVVPHHGAEGTGEKLHRTVQLAPPGLPVVGIDERTALVHTSGAGWRVAGAGSVAIYRGGVETDDLGVLPD